MEMTLQNVFKKALNVVWLTLFYICVGTAVTLSALRMLMPYADKYLVSVQSIIENETGLEVELKKMDTGWKGFGPALRLETVVLKDPKTHDKIVSFNYVDVQLDLISSFIHLSLIPGRLTLEGMDLILTHPFKGELEQDNSAMLLLASRFGRLTVLDSKIKVALSEGNPITLSIPALELKSTYGRYHFESTVYRTDMKGKMDLVADITGDAEKPETLAIDGYLSLKDLAYDPRFMPAHFDNLAIKSGAMNIGIWFNWHDFQWYKIIGHFNFNQILLQNKQNDQLKTTLNTQGDIAWERAGGEFWRLSGDNIVFQWGERNTQPAAFLLQAGPFDPWDLKVDTLSATDLMNLYFLDKPASPRLKTWIENLKPDATLSQMQIKWLPTTEGIRNWQVGFELKNWSNNAYQVIPAITGLNAAVKFDDKFGQIDIQSENMILGIRNQYSTPLQINALTGMVNWQYDERLTVNAPNIRLTYNDFNMDTHIHFEEADHFDDSILVVSSKTDAFDHVTAQQLLPLDVVSEPVVSWIHNSVERGTVDEMTISINGPIGKMPFKHHEGDFKIRLGLSDLELNYMPNWPKLTQTSGELVIDGAEFKAFVDHGEIFHSAINRTIVSIPFVDKSKPSLMTIQGNVEGPVEDAKNYILSSPLKANLGDIFKLMSIDGNFDLNVKLGIYLEETALKNTVNGVATLKSANIVVPNWRLALNDLNGSMNFTEHDYATSRMTAKILGFPAELSIKSNKTAQGYRMDWKLSSQLTDKTLNEYLPNEAWSLISGQSQYALEFSSHIPAKPAGSDNPILNIVTNWNGMAIHLPPPLGKPANTSIPTYIGVPMKDADPLLISLRYGTLLSGLMDLKKTNKGYELNRAQIALGDDMPKAIDVQHGLHLSGHASRLNVSEWVNFVHKYNKEHPSKGSSLPFTTDVLINQLLYQDFSLTNARTRLSRGDRGWLVGMESKELTGNITVPDTISLQKPMVFALSRCNWSLKHNPDAKSSLNIRDVPAIDFTCADTILNQHPFGHVEMIVRPQANGVVFDPIKMTGENDKLNARMTWVEKGGLQVSSIHGEIESSDIHASLGVWDIHSDVRGAEGDFKFDVSWPGGPPQFKVQNLTGTVDAKMTKGRFVGVDPGIGRILGLLSLQNIGRRLKLDFSDVFQKGFAFDSVDSQINIADGYAHTQKTDIKAPAASINIKGKTGLVNKTLDLDLYVHAKVEGTVPILGAAVAIASPMAGAALWVADQVFNPLGGLGEHHYHISGTWKDPVYNDLSKAYQAKLRKEAPVDEAKSK